MMFNRRQLNGYFGSAAAVRRQTKISGTKTKSAAAFGGVFDCLNIYYFYVQLIQSAHDYFTKTILPKSESFQKLCIKICEWGLIIIKIHFVVKNQFVVKNATKEYLLMEPKRSTKYTFRTSFTTIVRSANLC